MKTLITMPFLLILAFWGWIMIRNTAKQGNYLMLLYMGGVVLAIAGFLIYVYYWF